MFEGVVQETPEMACASLLEALPLLYSSLKEHQEQDEWCMNMKRKIIKGEPGSENFQDIATWFVFP
jgi:hypothetical protein